MSNAIPIVRPSATPEGGGAEPAAAGGRGTAVGPGANADATQASATGGGEEGKKLCRNVMIYGHCKFEQKGCMYAHPSSAQDKSAATASKLSAAQLNAPAFVPSSAAAPASTTTTITPKAPEFVPRQHTPALSEDAAFYGPAVPNDNFVDHMPGVPPPAHHHPSHVDGLGQYYGQMSVVDDGAMYDYHNQQQQGDYYTMAPHLAPHAPPRQALQYHHYHPPPASVPSTSYFLPPSLHVHLTQQSEAIQAVSSVDLKLPDDVSGYRALVLLPSPGPGGGDWNGWKTRMYKAWKDGRPWALRRIEGFRPQHEQSIMIVDKWTRIRHPGIVGIREAFTTRSFGDSSLVFVTDFHPLATSLHDLHFSPLPSMPANPWLPPSHPFAQQGQGPNNTHTTRFRGGGGSGTTTGSTSSSSPHAVPEKSLWSYFAQLVAAIQLVHARGMAVRNLEPGRVLVTGQNRVRIAGHAVNDVVQGFDMAAVVPSYQQDDLLALGKLVCAMATGSLATYANLQAAVEHVSRSCPADVKNLVLYLLSKPSPRKTIDEVAMMVANRTTQVMEDALMTNDALEGHLMRELENGRIARVLTKLGFINERPEFDHDPRWAETGDRYIIKLFRDYVFHQVDENGRPVTDLTHVLTCLNKLDAGVDERIMLVSRDEQSCLIVTYREVKNCIEGAFLDLSR